MKPRVVIHGGIKLRGDDTEVVNLDLEKLVSDPDNASEGSLWLNTTVDRVAYTEGEGQEAKTRYIANDGDLDAITAALSLKANVVDVSASAHLLVTNISNHDMLLGQPVYGLGELTVDLADATNVNRKNVLGLVSDDLIESQGGLGKILSAGMLEGTIPQWEFVTGMVGGLVPNQKYFLDIVSGKLTMFPTNNDGQFNCLIGQAYSSTKFFIRIERPVTL